MDKQSLYSIFFLLTISIEISSYKILVIPFLNGFNSRLLNLQRVADMLAQDGHDVTVLLNTKVSEHTITKHAKTIEFFVPKENRDVSDVDMGQSSVFNIFSKLDEFAETEFALDKAFMTDKEALQKIRDANFDLIFGDMQSMMTALLVSHLDIKAIIYQNFLLPGDPSVFYPIVPAITCAMPGMTCRSHEMDFKSRVSNFISLFGMNLWGNKILSRVEQFADELDFTLKMPLKDAHKNKVTIINTHYILDTPIPTMPHIFPISGLYHKEPSPLTKEFLDIVKSSEPHGVILLSFGTLISDMDATKADLFARVLGKLPQSVIWRFTGMLQLCPKVYIPPDIFPSNAIVNKWCKLSCFGHKNASKFSKYDAKSRFRT